ncbi:MAG: DUF488 domain-containing protein [Alphaproteobacteria bacterium]
MAKIFTIGQEKASLDQFLAKLCQELISLLVDIRSIPWSRRPEFSGTGLSQNLEAAKIHDLHLKALGNPAEGRIAAKSGDRREYHRIFLAHLQTAAVQEALVKVRKYAKTQIPCLLCYERYAEHCHRSLVTAALKSQEIPNLQIIDLVRGTLL